LNKQYSKEEYEKMVEKIVEHMQKTGEWGEFHPALHSPVAYNESIAFDYFPLTKEEALSKGFKWKDKEKKDYLPATKEILACEDCGKNYKIAEMESGFYEKIHTPIPKKCPDCRHISRLKLKNPRKLWDRECGNCKAKITTSYSPERPEIVYCEKCYLENIK